MQCATLQLLFAALLSSTSACASSPGGFAGEDGSLEPPGIMDVRFAVEPTIPEATVFRDTEGEELLILGAPSHFHLARAWASADDLGRPALGFRISQDDYEAFTNLTAEHVGEDIARLIDSEVLTLARLNTALPGAGLIYGQFTAEHVEGLLARLRAAPVQTEGSARGPVR